MAEAAPGRKGKLTRREREEREAWWARLPHQAVVLGVDPGRTAGAALVVPAGDGVVVKLARAVDSLTREVEQVLAEAVEEAVSQELPLVLVVEEWGRGGPRGLDQWVGLGEAVGAWRRALHLLHAEGGTRRAWAKRRLARVNQRTWRSVVVPETGVVDEGGGWAPFNAEGWKRAATRECARRYPSLSLDSADAAEAVLLATYAARSDEVGAVLPAGAGRGAGKG